MSTPAQNVPAEWQDTIDLPEPGQVDAKALAKYQADLNKQKYYAAQNQSTIKSLQKAKKATKDKKKAARIQAQIDARSKALATANQRATEAQNKVYETKGEFDKLLKGDNRDAYMALKSLFGSYGLGSLAGKIFDYVKQGYGADTIGLLLQDTKEYKERFAANETRQKAGLPVLSPAEYLSAESSYRQILSAAGLPKGFYDNPADFRNWIAGDVSPTEVKSRVDMAVQATTQANRAYKGALYQMYGINEADLTAYFLDRKKAEPLLKKQASAAAIGAAALRRGFALDRSEMENYATYGITADQAEQGYAKIADGFEQMLGIAGRFGDTWNQRMAEHEVFEPGLSESWSPYSSESASEKGKRLRSQERALFAGSKGSSSQGLSAGYRQT
ncbi:hypothetical protein [Streptomyces demainii]|uniref:Uncharacterized protein n=1 Tax=Streptomyces demainii TaxID=588122 RepID=A0ABT9KT18_9ACTN|nr:hypothetical protein [Streptomyces demainii]MDP9611545.1 hypothetical protein [Streptomyces demainii]